MARRKAYAGGLAVCAALVAAGAAHSAGPMLQLSATTEFPGVEGDMDHLAIDAAGQRLFVTAEDNGTLRVIDLKTGKLARTVKGFDTPHSILYLAEQAELYITDGSKAVQVLDSNTFTLKRTIPTTPGADSIGVDAPNHLMFAVTGGKDVKMATSKLAQIDTKTGKLVRELAIDGAHVEAMALERTGQRLFVNVTDKNYLAVIDRNTWKMTAQWPIHEAKENAPLDFDEDNHLLFVVCRDPGKLVVVSSTDGHTVASFAAGSRVDQVIFDKTHHRVYALSGEGRIYAYDTSQPAKIAALPPFPSRAGAKTGVLSADGSRLYVSVSPGEGKTGAKVLTYNVN